MIDPNFSPDDLDQFNFKSDVRRLGRRYRDGEISDTREINSFVAHYANLLVDRSIAFEGKVTTMRYHEAVLVTDPPHRNPAFKRSFREEICEEMYYAPDHGRLYVNQFRDAIANYVIRVATEAFKIADHRHMQQAMV